MRQIISPTCPKPVTLPEDFRLLYPGVDHLTRYGVAINTYPLPAGITYAYLHLPTALLLSLQGYAYSITLDKEARDGFLSHLRHFSIAKGRLLLLRLRFFDPSAKAHHDSTELIEVQLLKC